MSSSVIRHIVSVGELAADPRLAGMLDPPGGGGIVAGVRPRPEGGIRVASINIHGATPDGLGLDPTNESMSALRDVARFVNDTDPDVLLVQELRTRPIEAAVARDALSETPSVLAHLIRADDMAFTPAIMDDPVTGLHGGYGTAIYARNGFRIEDAFNARLPTSTPDVELRSAGVASVRSPAGGEPIGVIGTHTANRPVEDQALRDAQLGTVADIAARMRRGGPVAWRDALSGREQITNVQPHRRIVVAGDLNQKQAPTDRVLNPAGLVHVNDTLAATGPEGARRAGLASRDTSSLGTPETHRIDHVYSSGLRVVDSAIDDIPGVEQLGPAPTDHRALVVDLA